MWFDAEELRLPQHQISEFADLDRADLVVDAVGYRGIDGVLRDVAAGAVIIRAVVSIQEADTVLHHVRGLPGTDDHLTDAAHGLGVGGHYGDRAHIVQQVLGRHGGRADP